MLTHELPDTIFLPDRARLAINCLLGCLNSEKNQLPFCLTDLTGSPPRMAHTQFDYSDHTARVIDGLLLARAMTGSNEGDNQLAELVEQFFAGFDEDGLHYTPENPWSFRHANMHYQRSVINGLLSLVLVGGSERAKTHLLALTQGLMDISIKREGFAYFPTVEYMPGEWPRGDWGILGFGTDPANTNGRLLFGLTKTWELLGDRNARDLAGAYARHVMHHSSAYLPDGSFATGMEFREGHFHSRAVTMLGVIRYGHSVGDASALAWGKKVFDKACTRGTSFGWFPERLVETRAHGCETCAIVDMMEAAIWLARSGWPEYWETAERFLRNHLLESQFVSLEGLEVSAGNESDPEWETTKDVARRSVGGFAGWSQPNDLFSKVMHEWDLYTCCSAQGVRGLFNAWTQAVTSDADGLSVNLLINHISKDAVVRSWLPHEGRLEITPSREGAVRVRVPSWLDERTVEMTIDGSAASPSFIKPSFAELANVSGGSTIVCRFPVRKFNTQEEVLGVQYTADWVGDTVVGISPAGSRVSLYRRNKQVKETVSNVAKGVPDITFRF
ncbi:MAG: glycoside hydrolase family 127 protein [Hyphomicrobiaceae bacterium]